MKRYSQIFLLVFLGLQTLVMFQNCSSYNDPSPFEYHSKVPDGVLSGPKDLLLAYPNNNISVDYAHSSISASGACNTGGAVSNYIEIRMVNPQITAGNPPVPVPLPVRSDNNCALSGAAECLVAKQFSCEHGKYNIFLPVNCSAFPPNGNKNLALQNSYLLQGQLVTVDAAGAETRETKASFNISFFIQWAAGICL